MEKKTETPRTRNRAWGFFGTCVHNGHADPDAAHSSSSSSSNRARRLAGD